MGPGHPASQTCVPCARGGLLARAPPTPGEPGDRGLAGQGKGALQAVLLSVRCPKFGKPSMQLLAGLWGQREGGDR